VLGMCWGWFVFVMMVRWFGDVRGNGLWVCDACVGDGLCL